MRDKEKIKEYKKAYRKKNKAKIQKYVKDYRERERDKIRKYMIKYRQKNRDKILAQKKAYMKTYSKNPEVIARVKAYKQLPHVKTKKKELDKRYYETNKERALLRNKTYREANIERMRAISREYHKKHRAELKIKSKEYRDNQLKEFISKYKKGKSCANCGYNKYPEILQFHHKEGKKEFNISTFRRLKNKELLEAEIKKCVLLCPNCHMWLHYSQNKKHNK